MEENKKKLCDKVNTLVSVSLVHFKHFDNYVMHLQVHEGLKVRF